MKTAVSVLVALAGCVAASPAPQVMDLNAVMNAATLNLVGPPLTAVLQTAVYNITSADLAASSTVSSVAGTSSAVVSKREPAVNQVSSTSSVWTSSSSVITVSPTITASSTVQGSASTTTLTSSSACPTQPENGTYCGFINPEDPCAEQPDGYGPQVEPDTVAAFEAYPLFQKDALTAVTPFNYSNTFRNLNASVSANSYLGLHTLTSYDPLGCSQWCDNTTLCTGFNLYIERDPSLNPTAGTCPDPSSITNYKCTLWGSGVDAASATNFGDYREEFQVVIAGSNGYEKTNNTTPATQSGWSAPIQCPQGSAINYPTSNIGYKFFPGPFDPSVCASYAKAQTAYNKAHASIWTLYTYQPANMFNSYCVKKNGVAQGTYCMLYNKPVSTTYSTFKGSWSGKNWFGLESSYTYCLASQDSGRLY